NGFHNVEQLEKFLPRARSWRLFGPKAETALPLFARLHLLPDGTIFYDGSGQMWAPFGQATDESQFNTRKVFDLRAGTWTTLGQGPFGARSGTFSVMLPLRPPYKKATILLGVGTIGMSPGTYMSTNLTELISVDHGKMTSVQGPGLNNARWYSSGVLLPDGSVL